MRTKKRDLHGLEVFMWSQRWSVGQVIRGWETFATLATQNERPADYPRDATMSRQERPTWLIGGQHHKQGC